MTINRKSFVDIGIAIKLDGLSWKEYKPRGAKLQNREVSHKEATKQKVSALCFFVAEFIKRDSWSPYA